MRCANLRRPPSRRRPMRASAPPKCGCAATGRRSSKGQIDSAHSSSLHSSDMVPAQVDGAKATEANWLRPSTDKAPRFQIERTSYGFRYAAIRRPIMNEATHDYIRTTVYIAPVHRTDPAEQRAQCRDAAHAGRRSQHHLLLHRLERHRQARHRCQRVAQIQRARMGRRRRSRISRQAHARQPLWSGSRCDEAGKFHRHQRHSEPGHRHVGIDGPDQRPLQGAGRRQRRGGGRFPPPDGGCRPRHARWRPGDRHGGPHIRHATISSYEGVVPKTTNWRSLGGGSEAPLERVRESAK